MKSLMVLALFNLWSTANNKKIEEKNKLLKEVGAEEYIRVTHVEGLGIVPNVACNLFRFNDKIMIDAGHSKFELQFDRLRAAVVKTEQEITEKGKSVLGRALIGTLLLPGLGTIIGGMTGIGNKKIRGTNNYYLILNYIDSKGELSAVMFQNILNDFELRRFCLEVNKTLVQHKPEIIQL
jgi:hypothetical protein